MGIGDPKRCRRIVRCLSSDDPVLFRQQLIKRFELSIAYANKAMTLLWSLLWSIVIFHEGVTLPKIAGVILVIIGTIVINGGDSKDSTESSADTETIQTEAAADKEAK